jgi:membrane protein DedA with SNARE-associated domain
MLDKIAGLSQLQIDLLATFILLEGVAIAAIPEEIVILSLGVLWGQGRVGFFDSLIAAQLGLIPANFLMVLLGNKIGRKILSVPPFSWIIQRQLLDKALGHVLRHGRWTVFATRFIPIIRGPVYLAVGISRFPFLKFLKLDVSASFIQIPMLLLIGRLVGRSMPVEQAYRGILTAAAIGLGVSVVILFVAFFRRKHTQGRLKVDASLFN